MLKFSDNRLKKVISLGRLSGFSEKDLATLSLQHGLKGLLFVIIGSIIFSFTATILGFAGKVLGWVGIFIFCLFSLEPASVFLHAFISLVKSRSDMSWKALRMLISGISAVLYIVFAFIVYSNLD